MRRVAVGSAWIACCILGLLPIAAAIDFGGVQWWTQAVVSIAILIAGGLTLPSLIWAAVSRRRVSLWLVLPAASLIGWTAFQAIPVSAGIAGLLSRGSAIAVQRWTLPGIDPDTTTAAHPISVRPFDTLHYTAFAVITLMVGWIATVVFNTRYRMGFFLNCICISSAAVAAFGILRLLYPNLNFLNSIYSETVFGTFVNRNNAALFLNLGVASSLGLLAWRLAALTGLQIDDGDFEVTELMTLIYDRDSILAVVGIILSTAGLLVCGSRGGLASFAIGLFFALGWLHRRRGGKLIPVLLAVFAIAITIVLIPMQLDLRSIRRLEILSPGDSMTRNVDGRIDHWADGARAAWSYFPAGSGLGTYGDAYLPYQAAGTEKVFQHADNLWLEIGVEMGLPGILFVIAIALIMLRHLILLDSSVDPSDHGLRVCGWYTLAAVLVSQIFDFGLAIPANLFAVTVIVAITIVRARQAADLMTIGEKTIQFTDWRQRVEPAVIAGVILIAGSWATHRLLADARAESMATSLRYELTSAPISLDRIQSQTDRAVAVCQQRFHPVLAEAAIEGLFRLGRVADLQDQPVANASGLVRSYAATEPLRRRLNWSLSERSARTEQSARTEHSGHSQYAQALHLTKKLFTSEPLGFRARRWLLYLDFHHRDAKLSRTAVVQLAELHRGSARLLINLGRFAASSSDPVLAAQMFGQTVASSDYYLPEVLRQMEGLRDYDFAAAMPDNPVILRRSASWLVRQYENSGSIDRDDLQKTIEGLGCESCQTVVEKSNCLDVRSDLHAALDEMDAAIECNAEASQLDLADKSLHLKLIRRLRAAGRKREAILAARKAQQILPAVEDFQKLLTQYADEDTRGI